MNLTYVRKYQRFLRKTQGIFYKNPLLSLGLALPLVVIPSYGLTGTTAISAVMLVCFIPTVLQNTPRIPTAQMALGGFLLLGFFAAFCRLVHRVVLYFTMKAGENAAQASAPQGGEQK